jgi:hypothetical protein
VSAPGDSKRGCMALSGKQVMLGLLLLWMIAQPAKKRRGRAAGPAWSDEDMLIFDGSVRGALVPTEAALLVYTAESNLDPAASSGIAWGLPQITAGTLRDIGWTDAAKDFGKLGVADQSPWVQRLLQYQSKSIGFTPQTALDLFAANLSPSAASKQSAVIYDSKLPSQADAYQKNKGLDRGHKGKITRDDLAAVLTVLETSETYLRAIQQLQRIRGHG